jgi:hypothetical protein
MGKIGQVYKAIEKPLESNKKKDYWVSRQPCVCTGFQVHPKRIKKQFKDDVKKNGHAIFEKYSLEIDLFFLLPTTQKGVHIPSPLGKKLLHKTSNGLGKVMYVAIHSYHLQ